MGRDFIAETQKKQILDTKGCPRSALWVANIWTLDKDRFLTWFSFFLLSIQQRKICHCPNLLMYSACIYICILIYTLGMVSSTHHRSMSEEKYAPDRWMVISFLCESESLKTLIKVRTLPVPKVRLNFSVFPTIVQAGQKSSDQIKVKPKWAWPRWPWWPCSSSSFLPLGNPCQLCTRGAATRAGEHFENNFSETMWILKQVSWSTWGLRRRICDLQSFESGGKTIFKTE